MCDNLLSFGCPVYISGPHRLSRITQLPLPIKHHCLCLLSNARLYLAAFSAVLGNLSFGFALVYPSSVIPQLQRGDDPRLKLDTHQISWFGVSGALGFSLWCFLSSLPFMVCYSVHLEQDPLFSKTFVAVRMSQSVGTKSKCVVVKMCSPRDSAHHHWRGMSKSNQLYLH